MVTSQRHSAVAKECTEVKVWQKQQRWMGCSSGHVFRKPGEKWEKRQSHWYFLFTAENVSGPGASIDLGMDAKWGWDCWVLPLGFSQPRILKSSFFRCFFNIFSFTLVNFSISQVVFSTPSSLSHKCPCLALSEIKLLLQLMSSWPKSGMVPGPLAQELSEQTFSPGHHFHF